MNILLGITGSVSAYKTPWLVRDLRKAGHDVRVVMTPSARQFVAPLALEAVSLNKVIIDPYAPSIQEGGSWHVHLAQWADVVCIAPCSATTLARLATGLCDTALMTVVCSRPPETPLYVFPAMDTDMWLQPSTQRNVAQLRADGAIVVDPESGELASGLVGQGRLPEIDAIVSMLAPRFREGDDHSSFPQKRESSRDRSLLATRYSLFANRYSLFATRCSLLITAGPTHEKIDAVRSIVNHATGTMGFALAEAAQKRGYLVTLVTGPTSIPTPTGVERIDVVSAQQMYEETLRRRDSDVFIMAAAVADFTPVTPMEHKLKKESTGETVTLELRRTHDILAEIGAMKSNKQRVVGFALETSNIIENAQKKLTTKNADMIVANQAGVADSGFGGGRNTITIVTNSKPPQQFPPMSKLACAEVILDALENL